MNKLIRLLMASLAVILAISGISVAISPYPKYYWTFNEGAGFIAYEQVSGNFNATVDSNGFWTDGILGKGYNTSVYPHYFSIGDGDTASVDGIAQSVCAWAYPLDSHSGQRIYDYGFSRFNLGIDVLGEAIPSCGAGYYSAQFNTGVNEFVCTNQTVLLNQWAFICGVMNWTANIEQVWVNGQLVGSNTVAGDPIFDSRAVGFGNSPHYPQDMTQFNGTIDEIGFWDTMLTETDMLYWYNGGLARNYWGNETGNYTAPPAAYTVTISSPAEGQYLHQKGVNVTFQFNGFNATNCSGFANSTGIYLLFDQKYSGVINTTSCYNSTMYSLQPYYNGTYGAYPFENSLLDSSPYGKNGTGTGSLGYSPSKKGNQTGNYSLNLTGGYVTFGQNYGFERTNPFSIAIWINPSVVSGYPVIFSKRQNSGIYRGYILYIDSGASNKMSAQMISTSGSNEINVRSLGTAIPTGTWSFVTLTYDGSSTAAGLKMYYNTVQESLSVLANTLSQTITNSVNSEIGGVEGGSLLFNGLMDNLAVFNYALNQSEIDRLYSAGFYVNMSSTATTCNSTLSIESLNQSTNYTLSYPDPGEYRSDLGLFIACQAANSSLRTVYYDNDFTLPVLALTAPVPQGLAWNQSIWLNFTASEPVNCTVNQSDFGLNQLIGNNQAWYETDLPNGRYYLNISCTDLSGNNASLWANFTKDKQMPYITILSPSAGPQGPNTGQIAVRINFTDDLDLYDWNLTIRYYDTVLDSYVTLYRNSSVVSPTKNYLFSRFVNTLAWPNNTDIELIARTCDSHTKKAITTAKKLITGPDYITWVFQDGTWVNVTDLSPCRAIKTGSDKKVDRYSFRFEYDKSCKSLDKEYRVESNAEVVQLPLSPYPGHYVIAGKYWLDFGPVQGSDKEPSVESGKVDGKKAHVKLKSPDALKAEFNSIGELNCWTETRIFSFAPHSPGFLELDFDSLQVMLFLGILVILYIALIAIGLYFQSFLFSSMGALLGLFIGLLLYGFSGWLTLLLVLGNLGLLLALVLGRDH